MTNFWDQFPEATTEQNSNNQNNFWDQFDNKQNSDTAMSNFGKWGATEIHTAPKKNILTDFRDCLNWVNRTTLSAWQEGKDQVETAQLEIKDMKNKITPAEEKRLDKLNSKGAKTYADYGIFDKHFLVDDANTKIQNLPNSAKKGYVEAIKMLPLMWETIKSGGVGSVVGAGIGAGVGLATTKANTPQFASQGAVWGGRITGGAKIAELEAGLARNELKQINKEIKESGGEPLDQKTIDALSIGVGGVNGLLEMVGLEQILKTTPAGDKILNDLSRKKIKDLVTDRTLREQLKDVIKKYGVAVASETTTEMAQEATNIVAEHYAQKWGKVECTPLEQNVARVLETGKATFGATLYLGGVGSAAKATTILMQQGMTRPQAEQTVKNMTPDEVDELVVNNFDTLVQSVKEFNNSEEKYKKAVDNLSDKLMSTGKYDNKEQINKISDLAVNMLSSIAEKKGIDIDTLIADEMADIQQINEEMFVDEKGNLHAGIQENVAPIDIASKLNQLVDSFDNLTDDNEINNRIEEISLLEKIKGGQLSIEDMEAVNDLIAKYEEQGETEFAQNLKNEINNPQEVRFQRADLAGSENTSDIANAIKEWKEKGTDSKYFKKYSEGTKVLSSEEAINYDFKDGEGVTVESYHGGTNEFEIFDKTKSGASNSNASHIGFWFSPNNTLAQGFADENSYGDRTAKLYHVFIKMKNPKVYKKTDVTKQLKKVQSQIKKLENKIEAANNFEYLSKSEFYQATKKIQNSSPEFRKKYKGMLESVIQKEYALNDAEVKELFKIADSLKSDNKKLKELQRQEQMLLDNDPYLQMRDDLDEFTEYGNGLPNYRKGNNRELYGANNGREAAQKYVEKLKSEGYDGIIIQGTRFDTDEANPNTQFVVFDSTQIKSVDNRGTFDTNNPNIYYQSAAMYNDKASNNVSEFFNNVNKDFNNYKKAKYQFKNYKLSLPADTIRHDEKHELSDKDWQEIEDNIDNIYIANKVNDSSSFGDNLYNFGIKTNKGNYYYLCIALNKKDNYIITAAKNTKKGVDSYVTGKGKTPSKVPNALPPVAPFSKESSKNIINYIKENLNPNVNNHEDRNLVMAHASKSANIDNVIESGSLIAPSFSITARESETLEQGKFGDVLFIRNPKKINYQSDNIYDRDIYSPRMPMPHYDIPDGRVVDYYEYDSLKRSYENKPEQFVEKWGETFDEMFKGAKKVLFLGYTPSGNRRYVPYTNENILREMTRQGLVNKEGMDYGLSSLLARFSNKQTSKQQLKDAAKKGLGSSKDLDQKWEDIKQEYDDLGDKVAEYYYDKYSFYEVQSEAFYYIAKNKMSALKKEFDMKDIPADLIKEVKDFVEKASTLPRSYFEAKPMREVSLSEFNHALVRKGTLTAEQIKGLNDYGVKVTEYEKGELNKTLENLDKTDSNIYFQKQNKLFVDNQRSEQITNKLTQIKGSFIPAENLIQLFKDADESTIVHEFAHWWLEKLQKYAADSEELQQDLAEIRKFVKNNGEPFTEEQHERFARGFEAYMRTGSAKTNRLKKLFEDFKNALLSLYDSIRSLGFSEEEIPEINNLFDRLLTTENQRIQAAVFDRCNTLQAQIEEIKANQEKELAEIDEIEQANLERNLHNAQREKQVQEYLRLAEKSASRVPKEIKEYQKRFRDATFEILEIATGYKRQFIANPKNWEKVQEKIDDMTDPFSSTDGMHDSWREFYSDTGVSYDNQESDGDERLAYQAFDRLTSGDFMPAQMEEEAIGKFYGMFDYLAGKVMSLRGENKDAAFEALCSIFKDMPMMPDEAVADLTERLTKVGDTFVEQKANEKNLSRAIPQNVSLATQYRTYVSHKLHEMKSFDPKDKRYTRLSQVNKLYSMLKYATDNFSTKQIIRHINTFAIQELENRQKGILHKEIQKQVKINSKLIKVGALKQGKFDWKTNTVFKDLQDMNRLSLEDARKEYEKLVNADAAVLGEERENIEDNPTSKMEAPTEFQAVLKTKFLEYKSNKVRDLNLAATRSLLEDILELKFEGRRAKNEQELKKALSRYDYQNKLIDILYRHENNKTAKFLTRWVAGDTIFTSEGTLANWETLLNNLFDSDTAQKYSLLKTESDVEVYAHEKVKEFYKKALAIYGLNNNQNSNGLKQLWDKILDFDNTQPIIKLFQDYDNTNYTFKQHTYNKDTGEFVETNIDISHSQLITLYAWSLNPELKKRIITQFVGEDNPMGDELLEDLLFSKLSEQDKQFAYAMIDICDSMYEDTNEVFIRTTGLSLPRVDNYIPSKTERIGSDLDMMHETILRSTNPSFIKQRKNCRRIKMNPVNPLEIILPHINKTARYIVMSEKVNFYNRIFQAPDLKAAIVQVYGKKSGEKIHRILLNQLATSTYENYARSITVGKNLMDTVASNYITSKIGGNLKVAFSQLTSVINYAENMPAHEWSVGFAQALAKPKETIDYMFSNCPYLQARLAGNTQNEIISQLTNEADKFRSLRNFCTANTKYGDILAIMFGGKPYVEHLIKQGMTKEEAFEKFVENTLRSQQSGHHSATSAWQKSVSQNAFTRMIFAFNNTNLQYERKWVDAISKYVKGSSNKKEFAKAFLIYKVFNPILFTSFLGNLSLLVLIQNMFGGGDDDPFATFGGDIITSIALSNWKAYGILGIVANAIVSAVAAKATDGKFFDNSLPFISDFETSLKKLLSDKELKFNDYIEMVAGAGDYATGVAATRLYNAAGGVGDIAQGDIGTGLLRMIGYGRYRANMGAKGQPPR